MYQVLVAGLLLLATLATAKEPHGTIAVDVAIVFAVDGSGSVDPNDRVVLRRGHIDAILHSQSLALIENGRHGRIAVTYFEWGSVKTKVLVPWMVIDGTASAQHFAVQLARFGTLQQAYGGTSYETALWKANSLFDTLPFAADRLVVDVAGDGTNNEGNSLPDARRALTRRGIEINGLAIVTDHPIPIDLVEHERPPGGLKAYFDTHVVNGFTVVAHGSADFPAALQRKFWREVFAAK